MNDSNHIWKWLYESHDGQIQVNYGKTYHNKAAEKIKMLKAAKGKKDTLSSSRTIKLTAEVLRKIRKAKDICIPF